MNLSRRARPFPHSDGLNASMAGRQRIHNIVASRKLTSVTALAKTDRHRHDLCHRLTCADNVAAGASRSCSVLWRPTATPIAERFAAQQWPGLRLEVIPHRGDDPRTPPPGAARGRRTVNAP
jgi:hypothetical protein